MSPTTILNVILAVGVIAMVVTPLVWAILTQHRDHARLDATTDVPVPGSVERRRRTMPPPGGVERRRAPRPQYKPVAGRA